MGTKESALVLRNGALSIRQLEDLFLPLLNECKNIKQLCKVHAHIIKSSLAQSSFLTTKMFDICSSFKAADYAFTIFHRLRDPNVFAYNAMIRLCSYNQKHAMGIALFKQMVEHQRACPDEFTYPFVIKSCAGIGGRELGKQLHGCVFKVGLLSNLTTGNALLDMYGKCNDLGDARKVFDEMGERNVVSWNCLISGYVRVGQMKKARALFDEMGDRRSNVSWTAMISGYTRIGCYGNALEMFREMQMVGVAPDEISVVSVLPACAEVGALELGKWIHFCCERNGLVKKTMVSNALIEMYCSCGSIDEACKVFTEMPQKDVISWSTMIAGLANHGKGLKAIELFREMRKTTVKPNGITFVAVLSSCAHSGLVEQGLQYFDFMTEDYSIEPSIHHYSCLVDLLGRSGQLNRALKVIEKMPMRPDATIWGSLLSSCRTYRKLDVAELAMERLQEFEPDDTGNYVLLSNIYADLGHWDGVSKIRKLIRSKSLKKIPGSSSIEVDNEVQEFVSGHDSKAFSSEMIWVLEILRLHLRKRGQNLKTWPEDCVLVELF